MRYVLVLAMVCLTLGCMQQKTDNKYNYVCPGGQVVDAPGKCAPPTTTTVEPTSSTTIETTTTETTSTSTTVTSSTMVTSTTLCDDSDKGALLINELEGRCYMGYRFRMDDKRFRCDAINPGCTIGIEVTKPNGEVMNATADIKSSGMIYVDSLTIQVYQAHKDNGAYIGLIRIT
jgi:hypothetical protein